MSWHSRGWKGIALLGVRRIAVSGSRPCCRAVWGSRGGASSHGQSATCGGWGVRRPSGAGPADATAVAETVNKSTTKRCRNTNQIYEQNVESKQASGPSDTKHKLIYQNSKLTSKRANKQTHNTTAKLTNILTSKPTKCAKR